MTSSTSVAVFVSSVVLVLLCGSVHQCAAVRCTCPPHYFDTYASSTTRAQLVADGVQSGLFMMGHNQSQLLPLSPSPHIFGGEPAFRVALNMIAVLYEMSTSSDVPILAGDVNNNLLRSILDGLATDACNWVREVIPSSGITCNVQSLQQLHKRLSVHEKSLTARDAAQAAVPPTASVGGDLPKKTSTNRCAWINHRLLGDCRSTCTAEGATALSARVMYYEGKFGCSQVRNNVEDVAGDYGLCSNA